MKIIPTNQMAKLIKTPGVFISKDPYCIAIKPEGKEVAERVCGHKIDTPPYELVTGKKAYILGVTEEVARELRKKEE